MSSQHPKIAGFSPLPLEIDLESKPVLKALTSSHRAVAELKGKTGQLPNAQLLLDSLILREAQESSAIENIVTTQDEIFKSELFGKSKDPAAKEVSRYAHALRFGFREVQKTGLLRMSLAEKIQEKTIHNKAGFRTQAGTMLKNDQTGEIIYEPPQDKDDIRSLLDNLERYLNTESDVDPLVKMAMAHLRFEKIHPFYDGNGRTGRILNVLYLVKEDLLPLPILYMSRAIISSKAEYYRLLAAGDDYEAWILYMLKVVEESAKHSLNLIGEIAELMLKTKRRMRKEASKVYSQDLLGVLFRHPYTKISFIVDTLGTSRATAAKYLEILAKMNVVEKHKLGRDNYYINVALLELLERP